MESLMLKSKLHRAIVTHVELDYEGSCAIDEDLLDSAGIHQYEQIQLYNVDNGERITTYAIRAEKGSGIVSVNGAAAHKAKPGHRVIICAYAMYTSNELINFNPTLVYLDEYNRIVRKSTSIPTQAAS